MPTTVLLISGQSGSGKSSIAEAVVESHSKSALFQQDNYFTKKFLPYSQRSDASFEDGTGIDWPGLLQDMHSCMMEEDENSISDESQLLVVEGHMLGAAAQLLLDAFAGRACFIVVLIQCSQEVCKARRLKRHERSKEEWEELSQYFDKFVGPAFNNSGIPAMKSLREVALNCSKKHQDVTILEVDTEADDSLQANVEKLMGAIQGVESQYHLKAKPEVEEEVWSSMGANLQGFAQHELLSLRLDYDSDIGIELECVSSLSPLDMMNLFHGLHDSTGHSVWMGALLLCEALAGNPVVQTNGQDNIPFRQFFGSKRLLELGCGTGVAGIALLKSPVEWGARPAHISFTDNDDKVLDLCRCNFQRNLPLLEESSVVGIKDFSILRLDWGREWDGESLFDVVLATDVIYDVGCLGVLLSTASQSLCLSGYFVLGHVPRSCLPDEEQTTNEANGASGDESDYHSALENHIIKAASKAGLTLLATLRPSQIMEHHITLNGKSKPPLNETSLAEMEEVGAAILIFQKEC